jgi:hypothetical protein
MMITSPHLTLTEIAKELKCSLGWLSIVKNSDVFKDYWTLRSKTHSEAITSGIKEKSAALAELSLDALIEDTQTQIALGTLTSREARANLELVTKRFGFDGSNQPQNGGAPVVNLNLAMVDKELLADARKRMREVTVEVIPPPKEEPRD